MSDLLIKDDPTRDIVVTDGQLSLVTGSAGRAQRIGVALRHVRGEWFLDLNQGTDYFGKVLGKSSDLSRRAEFRQRILSVPGVREIQGMVLRVDPKTRALSGQIDVLDETGVTLTVPVEGV